MTKSTCAFDGCDRPADRREWCNGHAQQRRKGKPMKPLQHRSGGACGFIACDRVAMVRGLCTGHYAQTKRGEMLRPLRPSAAATQAEREAWLRDAFASRDRSSCWLDWPWAHSGGQARPYTSWDSHNGVPVARVVRLLLDGEWPEEACHTCDVPACINPDHIYAGTHSDNMRDAWRARRSVSA